MNAERLRSFLLLGEKPSKIVVTTEEGRQEVGVARNGVSWVQIAKSILSVSPIRIELFNANDQLLRAHRFGTDDDRPQTAAEQFPPTAPPGADGETQRLTHFADLLAHAHQFSIGKAFDKFVELAERQDARMAQIEARAERTENENRRLLREMVREELDQAEEMRADAEAQARAAGAATPEAIAASFMTNFAAGAAGAAAKKNGGT